MTERQLKLILLVCFLLMILEKMAMISLVFLKVNRGNPIEAINSNLSDQTKFRLNENNEIKDYFNSEI